MNYDLSVFLSGDEMVHQVEGTLSRNETTYDMEGIDLTYPIEYQMTFYKVDQDLELSLSIHYNYRSICSRCLKPVSEFVESTVNYRLTTTSNEADSEIEETVQINSLQSIPVDDLVISQVITSIPSKVLCKEDCKGICPTCGKDLNSGECSCQKESGNIQFDVLKDLFKDDKEV